MNILEKFQKYPVWMSMKYILGLLVLFFVLGYISDLFSVVRNEVSPQQLLRKYEWFKDTSSTLDAKFSSLKIYKKRLESIKQGNMKDGKLLPRRDWVREDRERFNVMEQEVSGLAASYNKLAAKYNSNMAKINWRFCNRGMLPEGATEVLPREYRNYLEQ